MSDRSMTRSVSYQTDAERRRNLGYFCELTENQRGKPRSRTLSIRR